MRNITRLHVWDMDGCIVDSLHRYRLLPDTQRIDLDYWIANEDKADKDTLLPLAKVYQDELNQEGIYTVIATARLWCEKTEKFAREILGYPDHVIARRDRDDRRGGAILKIQGLKKILNLKQFQQIEEIHVFEDNADYMKAIADSLGAIGHYHPSKQGY